MKKTTAAAILLVIAATLAFAGVALAGSKTIKQTGQIVDDEGTSVKLRVKVVDGQPQKIAGFKTKNVLTHCETETRKFNKRFRYSARNPFPVNADDTFATALIDDSLGLKISVEGKVKKGGKAVVGTIKTNRFEFGNKSCKAPKQKFETSS